MVTWGVLRLPVATVAAGAAAGGVGGEGALAAGLSAHLDGALAITGDASIAGALAVIPSHVTRIVELDATLAEDATTIAMLGRLLAAADAASVVPAAVVAARPMADALKRVEGDVVVSGLDRDGLMVPCLPFVLDRATLAAALADAGGAGDVTHDAVALLLAAGHPVLVVPTDGAPVTVLATSGGTAG
jgi:2-C-methyl-D-erythritol 4-phosphate cytidylyltransferase